MAEEIDQELDNEEELDQDLNASDDENLDDEELDEEENTASGSDEDDDAAGDDASDAGGASAGSTDEDDTEEDEEDPVGLAIMRSAMSGAPQDEQFDIRKLPRDENGLIDPEAANKAVSEWAKQREERINAEGNSLKQVQTQLSGQWQKGAQKFGHIWKNPDMREIALQMHLGSFEKVRNGTGQYISPMAALKRVDKMYKGAFTKGATAQKTRKRIIDRAAGTRGSSTGSKGKDSEYQTLKKQAQSRDPQKAAEGRRKLLIYRRDARRAAGIRP